MTMKGNRMKLLLLVLLGVFATMMAAAAPVTMIKEGVCHTAIYVAPDVMEGKDRVRLRESVRDLAHYLEKMTSVSVPIHLREPAVDEKVIPILIGSYADQVCGPFTMKTEFKQGYRLAVTAKGIGMQGETDEGISYAIYELLDLLGCRWYMLGEMGEVIPSLSALTLYPFDRQQTPSTATRSIGYVDDAFRRRNRIGGFPYTASHALEGYIPKAQLEQNPAWQAEIGGKRDMHRCDVGYRICWGNPEVAAAVADGIIARLDQNYRPCISIGPGDGSSFCECAKCRALDTGDWDDSMSRVSTTDRFIHFANQVAERVTRKYPDVKLGFLAYVHYTRPPTREKLHPALIPQLAPITYCRAHTLDDPTCASRQQIKFLLEGWGKASKHLAMYEYFFHLAEVSAPFPMIKRNLVELPVQYANNVTMWTPETMPNFETALPGLHLAIRMAWNSKTDLPATLNNFYRNFYGSASPEMKTYWEYIDDLWTEVPEHAGCGFGYMRRFTPEALVEARAKMNAALSACETAMEYRRVKLADDSLRLFELFMQMRQDYFAGKSARLDTDVNRLLSGYTHLMDAYRGHSAFSPRTIDYFKWFYQNPYQNMARIGREHVIMTTPPVNRWSYAVDAEKQGEEQGWQQADFDDRDWKTTNVAVDTWSALDLYGYFGSVWYRTKVRAPAVAADKKVYLWLGAVDGTAKVFVNGRHVPYVNGNNEEQAEVCGDIGNSTTFDITAAFKPGAENQITIRTTRSFLMELGTGGLMGPTLLYREK